MSQARYDRRLAMCRADFIQLQNAMMHVLNQERGDTTVLNYMREKYIAGDFPRAEKCKDRTVRFLFDTYYLCCKENHENMPDFCQTDITDSAIGSAVRVIVGDLR